MKKFFLLLILCHVGLSVLKAQPTRAKVFVTIVNEQKSPLENVTVELLKTRDSSLVKAALSDKNGIAEFENIAFGNYILKTNMAGRLGQFLPVSISSAQTDLGSITLQKNT